MRTTWVLGFVMLGSPLVAASLSTSTPQTAALSFRFGEHLIYDISWAGVKVGRGILESESGEPLNGRDVLRVRSTAMSNRLISYFFPVQDRIESVIDANGLYPYRITIDQRHGLSQRHKEVHFDQDEHTAVMTAKGRTSKFEIPPQAQDILSSLYYFRAIPQLESGRSVFIDVHESKKNWKLEIQILDREMLKTVIGTIRTVKVKAIVLFEGILWDKGDLYLWLTDDERRIPVMMTGRIVIGSITATLSEVEPHRLLPAP
ncbi:MAG: DUF3108 domain-containing protein [Nitrospirae bacterium]|nr:DUF3108 domain-containing protein [Nitrospirota bacterium]